MATIFQGWACTKPCYGEQSGFNVSFLFKWDGGDFWSRELISLSFNLPCIHPGICFLTHLSTVQLVEGGWLGSTLWRALPAWGPQDSTPASCFPGPALPAADHIMPFPWEGLGSTACGVDFSRTVSLLGWQSHAVLPRQSFFTWEKGEARRRLWGCRNLCRMAQ